MHLGSVSRRVSGNGARQRRKIKAQKPGRETMNGLSSPNARRPPHPSALQGWHVSARSTQRAGPRLAHGNNAVGNSRSAAAWHTPRASQHRGLAMANRVSATRYHGRPGGRPPRCRFPHLLPSRLPGKAERRHMQAPRGTYNRTVQWSTPKAGEKQNKNKQGEQEPVA